MAITTRPSNATKCVAKPVLDAKQRRHTKAQMEADRRAAEEEQKKTKQKALEGLERIAGIQNNEVLIVAKAQTDPPKPRPRPRSQRSHLQPGATPSPSEDVVMADVEVKKVVEGEALNPENQGETLETKKKKKKTPHHDAINAIHNTSHQDSHAARASDADKKGNLLKSECAEPGSEEDDKEAFLGHMQKWVSNIKKTKGLSVPKPRTPRNTVASTQTTTNTKVTTNSKSTAPTSAYPPPSTCVDEALDSDDELEEPGFLLDTDDVEERDSHIHMGIKPVSDIITISDGATEDDSFVDYSLPPFMQIPIKREASESPACESKDIINGSDNSFVDYSLPPFTQIPVKREASDVSINVPPPSKRPRTKGSQKESSESKVKYKNEHLPDGCLRNNKWRRVLIPTYAKWNGALHVGWGMKDTEECKVLRIIWDAVYKSKIPAVIKSDGPVHFVASQRMTEWRGGITSATILMITSLVSSDKAYATEDGRRQLGEFWLQDNRFLFANISADNKQGFTGMWKSPFILQTFAAHLHYILGAIEIPELDGDNCHPSAALALAAVSVKRAFTLLAENNITFEIVKPSGKGKKKAADPQEIWKASVNEARIPDDAWDSIIAEARHFMKDSGRKRRGSNSGEEDSSIEDDMADDDDDDEDKYTGPLRIPVTFL
ncbi:hypothetical protein DEU56DRAFT_913078 [Suillus clintonianus]|uniref:uncharacterized protein n=1 Tax=Suillus clintonianus TaxID=1904413 RepID=UPI001B875F84|nr:uncharacterized protein DEU56DRAFT_913078 [Suillus clintonianus]KAG2135988.1 hypothetical protein DEU56DRAFT_913078 [Suillus clintonianus]